MKIYLDASVIVPRFIEEPMSDTVARWIMSLDDTLVVSTFAAGEFASAVARLARVGQLDHETARVRLAAMDEWRLNIASVDTEPVDISIAAVFVRRFELALRLPDAIHLAACRRHGFALATFDVRMTRAAHVLDIDVAAPA